jgi:phenylalanine-4-hydroxylase
MQPLHILRRRLITSFARPHDFTATPARKSVGIAFDLEDQAGSLASALSVFSKHGLNLTSIQNRASPLAPHTQMFYVHLHGSWDDPRVQKCITELKKNHVRGQMLRVAAPIVPWFPRKLSDLDQFSQSTLDAGDQLQSDHPGFTDPIYRARRTEIAQIARSYKSGQAIPRIDYTEVEINTWEKVWNKLTSLYPTLACKEHNDALQQLIDAGLYGPRTIPQLEDISNFTKARTGFTFRPVTGLLSGRDFLNALAFRVFFSTQYIRHHAKELYTPEPDIIHELLGHAPMFLNPDFADFTQYIGLASLGASDEEIKRLATCYWFSVEFGLLREPGGSMKAYGAGLLSSFGELQYSTSPTNSEISIRDWEPDEAAVQDYPITTMQPVYFAAPSLQVAKERMKEYCDKVKRPFNCLFDSNTQTVFTDVDVYTKPVGMKYKPVGDSEWKTVIR